MNITYKPSLYAPGAVTLHWIPLEKDIYMINHSKRQQAVVLADCNDLYHSDEWEQVGRYDHRQGYQNVFARFEDGDRFLD
jgi:hypothetical protein